MDKHPWYLTNYKESFSAKDERRMLSRIESVMAQRMAQKNSHRDTEHLHPSELAKNNWCPRASYYKITDHSESDPDSFNLRRMNIFAEGDAIHNKWQNWMWDTGCLVGDWVCKRCQHRWRDKSPLECAECLSNDIQYREVPISDPAHRIIGHADGEWEDSNGTALVEIKSVGLGTIRWDAPDLYSGFESGALSLDDLWKRIKRPLLPHRRQINLYMYCTGIHQAIVIYEWKPTQEVKEFHLSYSEDLVRPMLDGADEVNAAVTEGTPPARPATFRKSVECKFCSYKSLCWGK